MGWMRLFLLLCAVLTVSACADIEPPRLKPYDRFAVAIVDEPDLSGTYTVARDGQAVLPLVGRVPVSGMTEVEAAKDLTARLKGRYLKHPAVSVTITGAAPR